MLNTADFNAGELALEGEPTSYNTVECGRQTDREREREAVLNQVMLRVMRRLHAFSNRIEP